jgi:hypothetical protein
MQSDACVVVLSAVSVPFANEQCELVCTDTGNPLEELNVKTVVFPFERDNKLVADDAEMICEALITCRAKLEFRAENLVSSGTTIVSLHVPVDKGVTSEPLTEQTLGVEVLRVAITPLFVDKFTARGLPSLIGRVGGIATNEFADFEITIDTLNGAAGAKLPVDACVAVITHMPGLKAITEVIEYEQTVESATLTIIGAIELDEKVAATAFESTGRVDGPR